MKKSIISKIILLLLSLTLCLVFYGCDGGETEQTAHSGEVSADSTDPADGSDTESEKTDTSKYIKLTEGGKLICTFVYQTQNMPDGVEGNDYYTAANNLATKVESLLGEKPKIKSDRSTHEGRLVTFGSVSGVSEKAFEGLRFSDYRIDVSGDHLCVAGYSSSALYVASEHIKDALVLVDGDVYVKDTVIGEHHKAKYQIESITVNGNSIDGYQISYSTESALKATELKLMIRGKSGYMIPTVENGTADKSIVFKLDESIGGSKVSVDGDKLVCAYSDMLSLETVWKKINEAFASTASGGELALDGLVGEIKVDDGLRIMSFNVLNVWGSSSPGTRDDKTAALVMSNDLDFVCLQEFDVPYRNAANGFISRVSSQYAEVTVDGVDAKNIWNPIFYDKTKFTQIESGYVYLPDSVYSIDSENYPGGTSDGKAKFRSLVWAVLRDNFDGRVYVIGNLHFSVLESAQTQPQEAALVASTIKGVAERYEGCTTLVCGDYNSRRTQTTCGLFKMMNAGFKDTWDMAAIKDDKGTDLDPGVTAKVGYKEYAIDHILTLDTLTVQSYSIITDTALLGVSDHSPTIVQFIKK